MNRILADVRAFGKMYLRSRVGAFFALAFPIILILLFGAIFSSSGSPQIPVYVQDLDGTPLSQSFIQALNNTTVTSYRAMPMNENFRDYITQHSINIALQIPNGFQTTVEQARTNASVTVNVTLAGDITQSSFGIVASAVEGVATGLNFRLANARPIVGVTAAPISVREFSYIDLFLPGIIGFTILTTPLFGMTSICAEYRSRKYFKLLATTKLTKPEWLAAKVIWHIALLFVSVALMFLTGIVVFGLKAVITPLAVLLIMAGTLEFTAMGMLLGIFVKDPETGAAVANAIGFPMMFLAGSFFPTDAMPAFLQVVARALPLTYVNEGLRATMVFGNNGTAFTYLLVTIGFAVVFFAGAARGLSWKSK